MPNDVWKNNGLTPEIISEFTVPVLKWRAEEIFASLLKYGRVSDIFEGVDGNMLKLAKKSEKAQKFEPQLLVKLRQLQKSPMLISEPIFQLAFMLFLKADEAVWVKPLMLLGIGHRLLGEEFGEKLRADIETHGIEKAVALYDDLLPVLRQIVLLQNYISATETAVEKVNDYVATYGGRQHTIGDIETFVRALIRHWANWRNHVRYNQKGVEQGKLAALGSSENRSRAPWIPEETARKNIDELMDKAEGLVRRTGVTALRKLIFEVIPPFSEADLWIMEDEIAKLEKGELAPEASFLVTLLLPAVRRERAFSMDMIDENCPYSVALCRKLEKGAYSLPETPKEAIKEPSEPPKETPAPATTPVAPAAPVTPATPEKGKRRAKANDPETPLLPYYPRLNLHFVEKKNRESFGAPWNTRLSADEIRLLANIGPLESILAPRFVLSAEKPETDEKQLFKSFMNARDFGLAECFYPKTANIGKLLAESAKGDLSSFPDDVTDMDGLFLLAAMVVPAFLYPKPEHCAALSAARNTVPGNLSRFVNLLCDFCYAETPLRLVNTEPLRKETETFLARLADASMNYKPAEKVLRHLFGANGVITEALIACENGGEAEKYANDLADPEYRRALIEKTHATVNPLVNKDIIADARQKLDYELAAAGKLFRAWADAENSFAPFQEAFREADREELMHDPFGAEFVYRVESLARGEIPETAYVPAPHVRFIAKPELAALRNGGLRNEKTAETALKEAAIQGFPVPEKPDVMADWAHLCERLTDILARKIHRLHTIGNHTRSLLALALFSGMPKEEKTPRERAVALTKLIHAADKETPDDRDDTYQNLKGRDPDEEETLRLCFATTPLKEKPDYKNIVNMLDVFALVGNGSRADILKEAASLGVENGEKAFAALSKAGIIFEDHGEWRLDGAFA